MDNPHGRVPDCWGQCDEGTNLLNVFPWLCNRMVSKSLSFVTGQRDERRTHQTLQNEELDLYADRPGSARLVSAPKACLWFKRDVTFSKQIASVAGETTLDFSNVYLV